MMSPQSRCGLIKDLHILELSFGTPASAACHEQYCPFRTALCFCWHKKGLSQYVVILDIPFKGGLCTKLYQRF